MHIITAKRSHERTPRLSRDMQFKWAAGARPHGANARACLPIWFTLLAVL